MVNCSNEHRPLVVQLNYEINAVVSIQGNSKSSFIFIVQLLHRASASAVDRVFALTKTMSREFNLIKVVLHSQKPASNR